MYAPIFKVCSRNAAVQALLGAQPTRLYLFDDAPDNPGRPYATWQDLDGHPENYLAQRPDVDSFSLQVDVFGRSAAEVRRAFALITRWAGDGKNSATKLYRFSFDLDWWVKR